MSNVLAYFICVELRANLRKPLIGFIDVSLLRF
jgi:hypothetical protein